MQTGFLVQEVLPGVFHIQDAMGVCCTLLCGRERALLFDTGYGLYDLPGVIAEITPLPLTVLCSHAHHDHACGNAQFASVLMSEPEMPFCATYTGPAQRARVLSQAEERGVLPAGLDREAYLHAGAGMLVAPREPEMDLGGLVLTIVPMPGHTPGSLGLYAKTLRLLLIGDNWNPATWLFFPECEPMCRYIETIRDIAKLPFSHVLRPHAQGLVPGDALRRYVDGLCDKTFASAFPNPIAPYAAIDTWGCYPEPDTLLVFDRKKL